MEKYDTVDVLAGARADPLLLNVLAGIASTEPRIGWVDKEKIALVVLPFRNLSSDPEQEFFSDGLSEDLISELARFKELFVVSRNAAFQFKNKAVAPQEVGRTLGVRYVIEGSVRKQADRLRVTSQLIDSESGTQTWGQRFDRVMDDIFEVQDEIVASIASALTGQIHKSAVSQLESVSADVASSYVNYLKGRWGLLRGDTVQAIRHFERAIELDPKSASAHSGLANVVAYGVFVLGSNPATSFAKANHHIRLALDLDSQLAAVHQNAALVFAMTGELNAAEFHANEAERLLPNDPATCHIVGVVSLYRGKSDEAMHWFEKSEKLEPYSADDVRLDSLCDAYYLRGEYEKVAALCKAHQAVPASTLALLAAAYAQLGDHKMVEQTKKRYLEEKLETHSASGMATEYARLFSQQADRDHVLEGYRKAGFFADEWVRSHR